MRQKTRKAVSVLIVFAVLFTALPFCAKADTGKIVVLSTNDVHCNIEQVLDSSGNIKNMGYAAVSKYKKEMQAEYGNENVTLVDAGDAIQGDAIGLFSKGAYITQIMNKAGYDLAAVGNHDFDYGFESFISRTKEASFPYVCCNLTYIDSGKTVFEPYKIISYGGVKIAYIGITTPETFTKSTPAYFQNSDGQYIYSFDEDETGSRLYSAIQKSVDDARLQGADYVIAIGHLGENGSANAYKSSTVISNTTGIDALIDAHSHEIENDTCKNKAGIDVCRIQTGTKLEAIGKLIIDTSSKKISAEIVKGLSAQDKDVLDFVKDIESGFKAELEKNIGSSDVALTVTDPSTGKRLIRRGETNLGDFCADAYRDYYKTDIGITNGGGIRAGIASGAINHGNVISVYPYGDMSCAVKATGQQILDALEFSYRKYPEESGAFLQVSGISFTIDVSVASSVSVSDKDEFLAVTGERRVKNVLINGKAVVPQDEYTVSGNTYLLQKSGDGFTMFGKNVTLINAADIFDVVLLEKYIKESGTIGSGYENPYGTGRIQITGLGNKNTDSGTAESFLYEVLRGDSLWSVSQKFYQNGALWKIIYTENANIIKDPNKIYPGEMITIPLK